MAWSLFLLITYLHLYINLRGLRSLALNSINHHRLRHLLREFHGQAGFEPTASLTSAPEGPAAGTLRGRKAPGSGANSRSQSTERKRRASDPHSSANVSPGRSWRRVSRSSEQDKQPLLPPVAPTPAVKGAKLSTPQEMSAIETLMPPPFEFFIHYAAKLVLPNTRRHCAVVFGCSVTEMQAAGCSHLASQLLSKSCEFSYAIGLATNQPQPTVLVAVKPGIDAADQLRAYVHSYVAAAEVDSVYHSSGSSWSNTAEASGSGAFGQAKGHRSDPQASEMASLLAADGGSLLSEALSRAKFWMKTYYNVFTKQLAQAGWQLSKIQLPQPSSTLSKGGHPKSDE